MNRAFPGLAVKYACRVANILCFYDLFELAILLRVNGGILRGGRKNAQSVVPDSVVKDHSRGGGEDVMIQ